MVSVTGAGAEDVMRGIASLLWPGVALVAVVMFRAELRDLIRRIRHGRLLGQEIALDKSLDELQRGAQALSEAPVPTLVPQPPPTSAPEVDSREEDRIARAVEDVLDLAAKSPRAALMQLAADLEREGRRLLAQTGHLQELRSGGLSQIAELLERATTMPRGSLDVFRSFAAVRSTIVHGGAAATDEETLRAIDSGIVLLRSLGAMPVERNVVYHPGVTIYGDEAGSAELPGHGVVLQTTSPGGVVVEHRIFPSTRTHFRKGMQVGWEWSNDNSWPEAWYRDPDSGEMRMAWGSSLEFIGRDLDAT